MKFDIDAYRTALNLAAEAHGDQKTPNGLPYITHIAAVAAEVMYSAQDFSKDFGQDPVEYQEFNAAIVTSLWHDVLEDTKIRQVDMKHWFTSFYNFPMQHTVMLAVSALSKDKILPKRLRMLDSIDRILRVRPWVGIVKMCDRIVNLDPTTIPRDWELEWHAEYRDEAKLIYSRLKHCGPYTASRLKQKIDQYPCL